MSNVWRHALTTQASSVGSFAIERAMPVFTPWTAYQPDTEAPDMLGEDYLNAPGAPAEPDIETVQAEAFAQGFEAGRRTAETEIAAERDAIARLAETLQALQPQPTNALAVLLAEAVERLVREIVGNVDIDGALLMERAEMAAAMIGEDNEPARLRLHPDDLPLIEPARLSVSVVADPALARGTVLLETGEGWIEDGPAVRLERLRVALDRIGAEA